VVTVVWSYTGLSTPEMEQRVTTYSQYAISSNVSGIRNNVGLRDRDRCFKCRWCAISGRRSRSTAA
jgi:hypothetical protein